jgi:hypothetical protein
MNGDRLMACSNFCNECGAPFISLQIGRMGDSCKESLFKYMPPDGRSMARKCASALGVLDPSTVPSIRARQYIQVPSQWLLEALHMNL